MNQTTLDATLELAGEYLVHPDRRDTDRIAELRERLAEEADGWVDPLLRAGDRDLLWSEREYIETLELSPPCPLYVGTYLFDEPETCRKAAISDRNPYLLQLENLYRAFHIELAADELPDFLPIMLDFLRVTDPQGTEEDVALRKYFVEEFMRPGLEPMHESMLDYESPYAGILETVREAVDRDYDRMGDAPVWQPDEETAKPRAPRCTDRLDSSSLPCQQGDVPSNVQPLSTGETPR